MGRTGAGSAGHEVLGLGVVADDGAGGLLGLVLEARLLADLDADAAGVKIMIRPKQIIMLPWVLSLMKCILLIS